jgi:hypothetical protein
MIQLPAAQVSALMKMGGGIVRLLDKTRKSRRSS